MKALYFDGSRVQVADRPEPAPAAGEVVVRVKRAGICATDLEIAKGYMGFRGVLGHELLGEVEGGPVAAALHVLDDLPAKRGDRVCVIGDGKLGLLCALVLASTPAEVTLVGRHAEHLLIAHAQGVRTALDSEVARGPGFDGVVEATG